MVLADPSELNLPILGPNTMTTPNAKPPAIPWITPEAYAS